MIGSVLYKYIRALQICFFRFFKVATGQNINFAGKKFFLK